MEVACPRKAILDGSRSYIHVRCHDHAPPVSIVLLCIPAMLLSREIAAAQKPTEQSPPALIVTPSTSIAFSGPPGGPFSPSLIEYRVSASIGTVSYSIRTPSWLTASSIAGATDTKGVTITLTVNASASNLRPGTYGPAVVKRSWQCDATREAECPGAAASSSDRPN